MEFLSVFTTTEGLISLFTLTAMEIILGIDNIIFISIVAGKLPPDQQGRARFLGLMLALVFRIVLLLSISWIVQLKDPIGIFAGLPQPFDLSWRDVILVVGGLFLMYKTIMEMHHKLEGKDDDQKNPEAKSFTSVIIQISLLDIVFSFDSILTAVGLADHVEIMIAAVIISLGIMLLSAKSISEFINRNPTMKMLALSFLLLIGFMLVAEGFDQHVDKGYIYFAMAFAFIVEILNNRLRKKSEGAPVELRSRLREDDDQ